MADPAILDLDQIYITMDSHDEDIFFDLVERIQEEDKSEPEEKPDLEDNSESEPKWLKEKEVYLILPIHSFEGTITSTFLPTHSPLQLHTRQHNRVELEGVTDGGEICWFPGV